MADLKNIDELRRVCSDVVENAPANSVYVEWGKNLRKFLAEVHAADLQTRASGPAWLEQPDFIGRHRVGVCALLPDTDSQGVFDLLFEDTVIR